MGGLLYVSYGILKQNSFFVTDRESLHLVIHRAHAPCTVHGAHSLKMLSVFHGMLVVGTDAIRAKTTKWTVPVTAHRIRQTNLKD